MSFWDDPQVLTAPLSLLCPLQKSDHCTVSDPSEVPWGSQMTFKLSTMQSDQSSPLLAGTAFERFSHLGEFPHHGPQIPIEDARNLLSQPPVQLECRHGTCAPPIRLTLLKQIRSRRLKGEDVPYRSRPVLAKTTASRSSQSRCSSSRILARAWEGFSGSGAWLWQSSPTGAGPRSGPGTM